MIEEKSLLDLPPELIPEANDLPGDLKEVADVIGVKSTLLLANRFRGSSVYFHNADALLRKHRNNKIREDSDKGLTTPRLARKYKLCERQIWRILGSVN